MGQRTALNAYHHFFDAFNSRDVTVFAGALNYPHVRVSWSRDPVILSNAKEHTRNHSWDPIIRTGWDHTEALPPEVFFDSSEQAHISGGWTRFDRDGRVILVNRVVYIVTRVAAGWGIQCRFGMDVGTDRAQTQQGDDAVEVVREYVNALAGEDERRALLYCTEPCYVVGVGSVNRVEAAARPSRFSVENAGIDIVQNGEHAVSIAVKSDDRMGLFYVIQQGGWKIRSMTWA
ncbi:MAG: hypothetical protein VB933_07015 [Pseudomonadales bacterium]